MSSAVLLIILIIISIILFYLVFTNKPGNKVISWIQTSTTPLNTGYNNAQRVIPIYSKDDLWFANISFDDNNTYEMLIDTGSSVISLPSSSCSSCTGPPFVSLSKTGSENDVQYGGGQSIRTMMTKMNSPLLGNNLDVSIVTDGSNPQGKVLNILGLLNPSLNIKTLTLDFPNKRVLLNGPLILETIPARMKRTTNINVTVSGLEGISSVILDTGTNYVLSQKSFPQGFSMMIGNVNIFVPGESIQVSSNEKSDTIILGNHILAKYKWEFDFTENLLYVD
jgi:hypothetical protein